MAILTHLSLDDAQRIGALFGLDVASAEGLLAGSVNSNYRLTLADGEPVFLRVYEEQTKAAAATEARMLEHLARGGVQTPRPLVRTDGSRSAEHQGKPVAIFPWIEGQSVCLKLVTPSIARRVGEALARVHVAGESFEGAPLSRFSREALEARLEGLPWATLSPDVHAAAAEVLKRIQSAPPRAPASLGVIHGDLFRDNVLWVGDEISALLDFESACRGSAAFDLAVTLLAWCYADDLDPTLARALARGYTEARPLRDDERDHLFNEASFAALRFAATRITDFELRPRGLSGYRSYRRFLDRLRTLERLGPDGLLTLLGI